MSMSNTKKQFSSSAYVHKAVHEYRHAPAHRSGERQIVRVLSVEPGSLAARIFRIVYRAYFAGEPPARQMNYSFSLYKR